MNWKEWLVLVVVIAIALFSFVGINLQFSYEVSLLQLISIVVLCFLCGGCIGWLLRWTYAEANQTLTSYILNVIKDFSIEEIKEGDEKDEVK